MQQERYLNESQFKAKLQRALKLNEFRLNVEDKTPQVDNTHIHLCWQVYRNARYNDHGKLVCGLLADLEQAKVALGGTNDKHSGSVLNILNQNKVAGEDWSILLNDCWILGGIHGHLPFQLASNPASEVFKSPTYQHNKTDVSRIMRVTGRELIGLTHFGYRACANPSIDSKSRALGIKFELRCFDKAKANDATIAEYLKVVKEYRNLMATKGAMPVRKKVSDLMLAV